MNRTRRNFLLAGLGLAATSCSKSSYISGLPGPDWPEVALRPLPSGSPVIMPTHAPAPNSPLRHVPSPTALRTVSRSQWAKGSPIQSRLNKMGTVNRITVHHEGWKNVYFTDAASTAKRLDSIRRSHLQRLRAGDIGYHFVIDRSGRLWEGRSLGYQGAHVSKQNQNNLGFMVLGNFNQQQPSQQQLASLNKALTHFMRRYRVPTSRVYTHREIGSTTCPGKYLQAHMDSVRRRRQIG